jgi:hypothetical protein
MNEDGLEKFVFSFMMAQLTAEVKGYEQMTAKAGIKKHGRKAEEALIAEFVQLEDHNVFEGIVLSTLTGKQKRNAL